MTLRPQFCVLFSFIIATTPTKNDSILADMMRLRAGCHLSFQASAVASLILMLRPRSGTKQWVVEETYKINPQVTVTEFTDNYGNLCQKLIVPAGKLDVETIVCVETTNDTDTNLDAPFMPVQDLPDLTLQFLLPSRYCQSDRLGRMANDIVKNSELGYPQVEAIRSWIHGSLEYQYGVSDASTSAIETIERKKGVCRDFTHLGIALCRSLNIPARMVVGYLYPLNPMDIHAWFEAFIGHRWYTFDATQNKQHGSRIAIAYGRDAADVALATQFGPLELLNMDVWVKPDEETFGQ